VHIVDFTAGVSPTGGFRYPAIPVQLVDDGQAEVSTTDEK